MGRALLATIAAILVVLGLSALRYAPPPPVLRDAPEDRFSAQRARDVQEKIVSPGGDTRMLGSAANQKARKALAAELTKAGLATTTQRSLSCSHHGACAVVENVVGKLEGSDPSLPAVLLSAHHDSVPASPGASDDGLGVAAVVETARALAAGPKPRRTVVVLLSDGEEDGLLGATAFAVSHPLAKDVKLAVNVDARGSGGPSTMFETSPGNRWLISTIASQVKRPVTTSLFYEVYKRMPNDTDFTAVKRIAHGLNFANLARIEHYHTPDDSLATTDPGTLQHHGDHALAATRALAAWEGDPTAAAAGGDAVWFDVLAAWIVWWPASWALPLAVVALALVAANAFRYRAWDHGVFVGPASLATAIAAPAALGWGIRAMGGIAAPWIASPLPALLSLLLAAVAGGVIASATLARRATPRGLFSGTWLAWAALGVAAAAVAPGTSYVFVVPAFAAGLAGLAPSIAVASSVPAVVAALVLLPLQLALYDALGLAVPALFAAPTALLVVALSPFWSGLVRAGRRVPLVAFALSITLGLVASVTPPFSTSLRQRANVVFRQDEGRDSARVFVDTTWGPSRWGDPPRAMTHVLEEGGRALRAEAAFPWTGPAAVADVPRVKAAPPELKVLSTSIEADRRRVRVHVRSKRGAPTLGILLPASRRVDVNVCPRGKSEGDCAHALPRFGVVGLRGLPAEGMDLELIASGGPDPIEIELFDRTHDLPKGSAAAAAAAARPPEATPFQDGDVTVISKSFAP